MSALRKAAPWILAVTIALRLPGFVWKILGIDDSDFTVIARAIAGGAVPYRDVVDIKPPLAFLLYLPNAWLHALWPVQVEGALFVAATALLVGLAARRTWGSDRAGALAAFLTVAAGCCEAPTVSTELLMNLPTAAGLALFARAEHEGRRTDDLLAGACLALAALIRHQAIFTLGALGLAVILLGLFARRPWLLRAALLAIGFALPWLATVAAFQAAGALPDFIDWVFLRNFRYVGQNAGSTAARLLQSLAVCILAAAPLAWWAALAGGRGVLRDIRPPGALASPEMRLRATWALLLAVSCVPVSLGGRFYEHYFLQFVPAVALLGAGPLEALLARAAAWSRPRRALLAALAVLPALGSTGYATARGILGQYPLQNTKVQAIGAWMREHTAPGDTLFVWGHYSPIYLAADRPLGTRYLTTSWHLGNFDPSHLEDGIDLRRFRSDRDVKNTLDDLARRRPDWVIDTTPSDIHDWHRLPLSLLPDLEAAIDAGWEAVGEMPGGARVLRRRDLARGEQRRRGRAPLSTDDDLGALPDPAAGPDEVAMGHELGAALERAIDGLAPPYREVLVLRDVEGLTAPEVAASLGIGVDAVKSRLHRARAAVRERLAPVIGPSPAPAPGCPDIQALFSRRLEGQVDAHLCETMERHLAGCAAACDGLKRTLSLCASARTAPVPPEVQESVRRAVRALLRAEGRGTQAG